MIELSPLVVSYLVNKIRNRVSPNFRQNVSEINVNCFGGGMLWILRPIFILGCGCGAWWNKTRWIILRFSNELYISFVLFPRAPEPGMNFSISKVVYWKPSVHSLPLHPKSSTLIEMCLCQAVGRKRMYRALMSGFSLWETMVSGSVLPSNTWKIEVGLTSVKFSQ